MSERCIICGERTKEGDVAEMFDPIINQGGVDDEQAVRENLAGIVHPDCGQRLGWEIA
jgi:hypothetical protein